MARRALKTDDEAGFLMAVYDDWCENELMFGVQIEMRLVRGKQRGTFDIVCDVYKSSDELGRQLLETTRTPYPSHSANRLHAGLYRAQIAAGGVLARRVRDRAGEGSEVL